MSILLASNDTDFAATIKSVLQASYPEVPVYLPNDKNSDSAELAACWCPSDSLLVDFPHIKVLHALSAGVDHLGKKLLTSGLPVCRIVDPVQKQGMLEYILWGILNHQRDFEQYRQLQEKKQWQIYSQRPASETRITLLGLGEIGSYVAVKLAQLGYTVNGWSKSPKELINVTCYDGEEGLNTVLNQADVLVNLLPLNSQTQGILSQSTFNKMPQNSYLINCGRGEHLLNHDLIHAIQQGRLKGALLDVFDEEPLPVNHPFWESRNIIVTPHIASSSSIKTIVDQVVTNVTLFKQGKALNNMVIT